MMFKRFFLSAAHLVLICAFLSAQIHSSLAQNPLEVQHVMTERIPVGFKNVFGAFPKGLASDAKKFEEHSLHRYVLSHDGKRYWLLVKKRDKFLAEAGWQVWTFSVDGTEEPVQTKLYQPEMWYTASLLTNGDGSVAWIWARYMEGLRAWYVLMRAEKGDQFTPVWNEKEARERKERYPTEPAYGRRVRTTVNGDAVFIAGNKLVMRVGSSGSTTIVGEKSKYKRKSDGRLPVSNLDNFVLSSDGSVWGSTVYYETDANNLAQDGHVVLGSSLLDWELIDNQGSETKATMSNLELSGDGKTFSFKEYMFRKTDAYYFGQRGAKLKPFTGRDLKAYVSIYRWNWDGSRLVGRYNVPGTSAWESFLEHIPTGRRMMLPPSNIYHWLQTKQRMAVNSDLSVFLQANDHLNHRLVVGTRFPYGNQPPPKFSYVLQDSKITFMIDFENAAGLPKSIYCDALLKRYMTHHVTEERIFKDLFSGGPGASLRQSKDNPTHFESKPRDIDLEKLKDFALRFTIPNSSTNQIVSYDAWIPAASETLSGEIDKFGPGVGGKTPDHPNASGGVNDRVVLVDPFEGLSGRLSPKNTNSPSPGTNNPNGNTPEGTTPNAGNGPSSGTNGGTGSQPGNRPKTNVPGGNVPDNNIIASTNRPPLGDRVMPPRGADNPPNGTNTNKRMILLSGTRKVKSGQTVQIPVYLFNAKNVANMNFELTFDTAVLTVKETALKGNVYPASCSFVANAPQPGKILVGFADSKGVSGSGTAAEIRFEVKGRPGNETPLNLSVSTINDASGKELDISIGIGRVTVVGEDGLMPGDVDGDGKVTALDALMALKMSVKLIEENKILDMDADNSVTSRDAVMIMQQALRN